MILAGCVDCVAIVLLIDGLCRAGALLHCLPPALLAHNVCAEQRIFTGPEPLAECHGVAPGRLPHPLP